jgi:putative tricarboxylic transport membrane protein
MVTKRIRRGEGFFWLGMGVFICILSWQTGFGFFREPGPGFVAFVTGLCMAGIGLVMALAATLVRTAQRDDREFAHAFGTVSWFRMLYATALLLVYAALVEPLGFVLTTLLVLWGLFYDWDKKNWFSSFLGSCATSGISYIFFEKLLGLPFPPGIFG